jgi:hypothetical protein
MQGRHVLALRASHGYLRPARRRRSMARELTSRASAPLAHFDTLARTPATIVAGVFRWTIDLRP